MKIKSVLVYTFIIGLFAFFVSGPSHAALAPVTDEIELSGASRASADLASLLAEEAEYEPVRIATYGHWRYWRRSWHRPRHRYWHRPRWKRCFYYWWKKKHRRHHHHADYDDDDDDGDDDSWRKRKGNKYKKYFKLKRHKKYRRYGRFRFNKRYKKYRRYVAYRGYKKHRRHKRYRRWYHHKPKWKHCPISK